MNRPGQLAPNNHRKYLLFEEFGKAQKLALALFFTGVLVYAGATVAQEGPAQDFSIDSYSIDGGGGTSTGGTFSMTGTIGQHDASVGASIGGIYSLTGGFWGTGLSDHLFSSGFEDLQ